MARKRRSGASPAAKLTRNIASRNRTRKRSNPRPRKVRSNPPVSAATPPSMFAGLTNLVAPGVASYAAGRLAGRIAYKLGKRKSVRFAKHAGALTPPIVAVGTLVAAGKIASLEPYRTGLIVGTTIAGIQSLVQAYIPQYGWILNDYHLDDVLPLAAKKLPTTVQPPPTLRNGQQDEIDVVIEESEILEADRRSAPLPADDLEDMGLGSWASSLVN